MSKLPEATPSLSILTLPTPYFLSKEQAIYASMRVAASKLLRRQGVVQPSRHAGRAAGPTIDDMLSVITAHAYTSQSGSPINTRHVVWKMEAAGLQGAWTSAW